jgi:hypothetical protein
MAHGKSKTYGKGSVAVRPRWAHDKGRGTAMPSAWLWWSIVVQLSLSCTLFCCCRESFLCRALVSIFAVASVFAVRFSQCSRQRSLCCAGAHGKDSLHGSPSFARSENYTCCTRLLT